VLGKYVNVGNLENRQIIEVALRSKRSVKAPHAVRGTDASASGPMWRITKRKMS
jgi:hypothetical protein